VATNKTLHQLGSKIKRIFSTNKAAIAVYHPSSTRITKAMESKFDRKLPAARKFARSLFLKNFEGKFLFFSRLPAEIRLIVWKMAVTAHPHPGVQTLLYGLVTGAIIPKNIRIDNNFYGKSETPTENKITIKANCPLLQTCKEARDVTLAVYSRYIEVCTCAGQHYSSYSETPRRHL
jgi:2EXR family